MDKLCVVAWHDVGENINAGEDASGLVGFFHSKNECLNAIQKEMEKMASEDECLFKDEDYLCVHSGGDKYVRYFIFFEIPEKSI